MAAGKELDPTAYIGHHLTHDARPFLWDGGFWTVHLDSVAVAILLGFVGIGFIWWIVRDATSGVPNKRQAFVEVLVAFVDEFRAPVDARAITPLWQIWTRDALRL